MNEMPFHVWRDVSRLAIRSQAFQGFDIFSFEGEVPQRAKDLLTGGLFQETQFTPKRALELYRKSLIEKNSWEKHLESMLSVEESKVIQSYCFHNEGISTSTAVLNIASSVRWARKNG